MNKTCLIRADRTFADILYEWANDSETRKNAFHQEPIPYDTHIRWFEEKLKDDRCEMYICKSGEQCVGQIRVEWQENQGIISYSVDKEHRGRGYGEAMLWLLEEQVRQEGQPRVLVGQVKYQNLPSRRCFEKVRYNKLEKPDYIEYYKVIR